MIDRIGELLSQMAAEDDEEEREDVLAPAAKEEAVPILPPKDRREIGETEREDAAGELWKDGPVWTVQSGAQEMDAAQKTTTAGRTGQEEKALPLSLDGDPVWAELEWTARDGAANVTQEGPGRSGTARTGLEQTGLNGLYRQTVRGLRPAAPALPPEQAGKTARAQEPESAASLAVDELDRAVRRDSRRYDGGMSIY